MYTEKKKSLKILYICTHNRCRSILSEAVTNQTNNSNNCTQLIAKSAGSTPSGQIHPLTLKYLVNTGYSIEGLTSNSWDDTKYIGDFEPDVLITVCDNAAGETCPIWLGHFPNLVKLHWGLKDPSKNTEDEMQAAENFRHAISQIEKRVAKLQAIADLPSEQRRDALEQLVK